MMLREVVPLTIGYSKQDFNIQLFICHFVIAVSSTFSILWEQRGIILLVSANALLPESWHWCHLAGVYMSATGRLCRTIGYFGLFCIFFVNMCSPLRIYDILYCYGDPMHNIMRLRRKISNIWATVQLPIVTALIIFRYFCTRAQWTPFQLVIL